MIIKDINIDCDGVLVPNWHEEALVKYAKDNNLTFDNNSKIWDWYQKLIINNPLPVNHKLLRELFQIKLDYNVRLHLWTNRDYELKKATLDNIIEYANIFDTTNFYDGYKINSRREGIIIDNDKKYLNCGEYGGIHYEWKGE